MKKSLVLAMAMALGVTASAYAANPFSDVPAGHWAYDSVNKLAAAGVVEGYPDGTYGGDKLMTRYEMAQIVAKAMAKGANVDKLAAEFADELDSLGVRVANLEKKADNVKITGEVRYRYADHKLMNAETGHTYDNDLRSRLWVNGQINDDWSYTAMLENTQDFADNEGNEGTEFKRAYVQGKIGGLDITAGRYGALFGNGNIYDAQADGAEISFGDNVKIKGFVGKATDYTFNDYSGNYGNYAGGEVVAGLGENVSLSAGYVNFKDMYAKNSQTDNAIWHVGADFTFGDFTLSGMYLKGDMSEHGRDVTDIDNDGYTVGLSFKGAEASKAGSYGLWAKYYDQGGQTYVAHTTDANTFNTKGYNDGFKGYGVGANYAFAKNIVGTVAYYDTENKRDKNEDDQIIWADLTFNF